MRHRPHPHVHRHPHRRSVAALMAIALAVAACSGDDSAAPATTSAPNPTETTSPPGSTTSPTTSTTPTATTTTTTTSVPRDGSVGPSLAGLRSVVPFADYRWVPPLGDDARYAGPPTPTSFDEVLLVPDQQHGFESMASTDPTTLAALVERLEANGFAIHGRGGNRFFHDGYKGDAYWDRPLFVTTDALYHSWHLVFDKVLRDTEQVRLLPILEEFLRDAVAAARDQETDLAGTALADAAHRATAYYEAAAVLLELDVGTINDLATAEVGLVAAAAGMETSPITGVVECQAPESFVGCVDFSLFLPRGHYNRTPDLQRYFRAMSLLGQEGFALDRGIGVVPGLLVTRVLVVDPEMTAAWTALYEPTAFLVGLADDIDPFQLAAAADEVVPGWASDPERLLAADAPTIAATVLADHAVAIDPERASVRVMGARFTLDSFILDQLAWPNVGREPADERRVHVSALDVAAAFGSPLARDLQLATESSYDRYEDQLTAMTEIVATRRPDDWAGTVYDAWLAAIEPQFRQRTPAYPDFMRNDAWAAKSLQTGLASYTELKHDTVLYTKQGSSGEGDGPEPATFVPRHWVEPDPVAFGRIAAAAGLLRDGFAERDLLTDGTDDLLGTLIELSDWLGGIATRELAGTVASDSENQRLRDIGSELEYLWIVSSDIELNDYGAAIPDVDERAGLVTDIFTTSFDYLQLGTGDVQSISVIVPIGDGRFELAEGQVASYYEFWRSTSEPRLTDEEWRSWLSNDEPLPDRPEWAAPFLVEATGVPLYRLIDPYRGSVIGTDPYWSFECGVDQSVVQRRGDVLTCQATTFDGASQRWHIVVLDDRGTGSWVDLTDRSAPPRAPDGLLCREYLAQPGFEEAMRAFGESPPWNDSALAYHWALTYWFEQGQPVRMDVDDNGIPCELLFDPAVVAAVWAGGI